MSDDPIRVGPGCPHGDYPSFCPDCQEEARSRAERGRGTSEKLKPCPFCGGPGKLASGGEVVCMGEGCTCYMPAEHWNTRAPGPATKVVLKIFESSLDGPILIVPTPGQLRAFVAEWEGGA